MVLLLHSWHALPYAPAAAARAARAVTRCLHFLALQGRGGLWGSGDLLFSFLGVVILTFGFKVRFRSRGRAVGLKLPRQLAHMQAPSLSLLLPW